MYLCQFHGIRHMPAFNRFINHYGQRKCYFIFKIFYKFRRYTIMTATVFRFQFIYYFNNISFISWMQE